MDGAELRRSCLAKNKTEKTGCQCGDNAPETISYDGSQHNALIQNQCASNKQRIKHSSEQ